MQGITRPRMNIEKDDSNIYEVVDNGALLLAAEALGKIEAFLVKNKTIF